jgi:hypothetical protein
VIFEVVTAAPAVGVATRLPTSAAPSTSAAAALILSHPLFTGSPF